MIKKSIKTNALLKGSGYICILTIMCLNQNIFAQQITVNDNLTPSELIEDNLILGCVEVSNIESNSNGSVNQITSYGYFERGTSNFPFENGILLSSGSATAAGNTTNANALNDGEPNWGTDADLENALGIGNTLNATSIEFDFVSVSNQIQFNYILASEEYYANYPCEYSDGFAFLIKPTASAVPYTNIAVIPNTNIPVNTNTIHEEIVGLCPAENETFFEGYNLGDTNFNGRTTVMTATATIQPNVQYHIKLVIADQNDENFDSAVFIEGNSFNATVNLGPDITTCADNTTLNADTDNPLATYSWYQDGQILNSEISPNLTVTESGVYTVNISIPINNTTCEIQDDILITLNSEQSIDTVTDYEICDNASNGGVRVFNLSTKTPEIIALLPPGNYNITYHYNQIDAENGDNPITSLIQNSSNPQTIYVRIEDIDNGCITFANFQLRVNPLPSITDPEPLMICDQDGNNDGFTQIDLTQINNEVTNNNPDVIVTYHYTQTDANTGDNPIPQPYVNTNPTEQVFIRVTNPATGCSTTSSIDISVLELPDINDETQSLNACEQDGDGFETFDLTEVIDDVLQGLTDVSVTFHTTFEDAETGDNPIPDITNFQNTTPNVQVIYIRVIDDATGCPAIAAISLHTNILESETNIRNFFRCDDDSNDGIAEFNLENIANTIINGLPNVSVEFYESEDDQTNSSNAINQTTPYEVTSSPHLLYVTIIGDNCTHIAEINLIINPATIIQPLDSVNYCDTDDDGFTSIELSTFDNYIETGISNPEVSYYLSQTDADNQENVLPPFYTNTVNPQTFYVSVRNTQTGCRDTSSIEINVIPAPTVMQPGNIVICDDDQDAFYTINLDDKISEIVTDTTDLNIFFFTTLEDANNNTNAITNTTNYSTDTQTIYTRVESDITGCYALVTFEIIVNTEPVFSEISNFTNCETDGDQTAEFYFIDKDQEILNGQTGKQALYFENENDAINRINIINKTAAYTNNTSPQTIYVRVENVSDHACYGTASFTIEVGSIPIFDAPLDQPLCDDVDNDGQEIFDLSEVINQMSQNSPENLTINFYESLDEAENDSNRLPLNYENQENPQQIYARIENGTYCYGIAEFGLQVIQVPLVNSASQMTQCDTDFDESATFDLTVAEAEVLDIRQDDILVSYHQSIDDVDNNVLIQNPNAFNNTSNPQTVYIKVTNTVSQCYVTIPLDLMVNTPPTIVDPNIETCENGNQSYNLTEALDTLMGSQENINATFYSNQNDAETQANPLDNIYTYTSNNDMLFIRAENTLSGCVTIASFNLLVNPMPIANVLPDLEACDDDFDAMLIFDLSQQTSVVLGSQNPNQFTVSYFELEEEAIDNTNPILDLNYNAFDGQPLFVRVENNTTHCFNTTSFVTYVHRKPIVEIPDQTVCLNSLPLLVSAETGFDTDTYQWSTNASSSEIEITQIGTYSVTVTTDFGCTTTATFNVIESEQATIEFTETVDFSDPNNITVTVSGIGDYVYILDGGPPQETNTFYNVTLGPHTIEVYDLNGCASAIKEIMVIDAPLFFTPNNDGQNDTWQITGIDRLPGTIVYIFDRYGKLLKTLSHTSIGWNGTYNGNPMPTNDYWFVAKVVKGEQKFEVKGHFTLKR